MSISPMLRYRCLGFAKGMSPVDSGNLRHNAIRLTKVKKDGFTILYDSSKAHYIEAVEEGEGQPAQKFIFRTYLELSQQLKNYYGTTNDIKKFRNFTQSYIKKALSTAQDNPERRWRQMQSELKAKGIEYNWR